MLVALQSVTLGGLIRANHKDLRESAFGSLFHNAVGTTCRCRYTGSVSALVKLEESYCRQDKTVSYSGFACGSATEGSFWGSGGRSTYSAFTDTSIKSPAVSAKLLF